MHNLSDFWNEETENQLNLSNLTNLQKFLNKHNDDDNWQNPRSYTITEYIPNDKEDYEPIQYNLLNLKLVAIEDRDVIFDDGEGILEEAMYNNTPLKLHSFDIDSIIMIQHVDNVITISLEYGYIKIQY